MRKNELEDVWRQQHKDLRVYTRKISKTEGKQTKGKRIDYIMVDTKHAGMVTETEIMQKEDRRWGSDHRIVKMNILGLPLIRELSRQIWQKPTYDMKALLGRRRQLMQVVDEWTKDGCRGKEAIEQLNNKVKAMMTKEGINRKKKVGI